ncbi:hypothetical protein HU200_050483 [Digitaria exilis]|uniref:Uncharacterized protein n=1 Tax=Digitaria exilis TaxID=1010633 RepID=A0A835ARI5_9POAL|nr:hypothetical protein HU200_050483 [Digitaria exilis]
MNKPASFRHHPGKLSLQRASNSKLTILVGCQIATNANGTTRRAVSAWGNQAAGMYPQQMAGDVYQQQMYGGEMASYGYGQQPGGYYVPNAGYAHASTNEMSQRMNGLTMQDSSLYGMGPSLQQRNRPSSSPPLLRTPFPDPVSPSHHTRLSPRRPHAPRATHVVPLVSGGGPTSPRQPVMPAAATARHARVPVAQKLPLDIIEAANAYASDDNGDDDTPHL